MPPDGQSALGATRITVWTSATLSAVAAAYRGDPLGGAHILASVLAAGRHPTVCAASALTVCAGEKARAALGAAPSGARWCARPTADGQQDPTWWAASALAAYLNDDERTLGQMFWNLPAALRGERMRALFDLTVFGQAHWGERLHATTDV